MRKTALFALGIAGAFACTTASATTYLCTLESPEDTTLTCADITLEWLAASDVPALAAPVAIYYVTHYSIEPAAAEIDVSSPEYWSNSEPGTGDG